MRRLYILFLLIPILALSVFVYSQSGYTPFTEDAWTALKEKFWQLYNDKSAARRTEAVGLIRDNYGNIVMSDDKYQAEAAEILLRVISAEPDNAVGKSAGQSLASYLYRDKTLDWLADNYRKYLKAEAAKLAFIGVFANFRPNSKPNTDRTQAIFKGLLAVGEPGAVRLAAIKCLANIMPENAVPALFDLVSDQDISVSKEAVKLLNLVIRRKDIPGLIDLLGRERRPEIKDEIGAALEKATSEKYGANAQAWRKWWSGQPAGSAVKKERVDSAIRKGVDFLLRPPPAAGRSSNDEELVFYTLLKSGAAVPDKELKALEKKILAKKLDNTYRVALLAMALSEQDRSRHINKIVQCAEFLLANQSVKGHWTYGKEITCINTGPFKIEETKSKGSTRSVKKIVLKMPYRRTDDTFDNSNTQYAILGLRACAEAGIDIPLQPWADAEKHLLATQCNDGGWWYGAKTASGYGSMTAGGLGGLAICKFYLNKPINMDKNIRDAVNWLGKNFSVAENPKGGFGGTQYYYLYSLERAGILSDTVLFGKHDWYAEGAAYLLDNQLNNGSWRCASPGLTNPDEDTCFAILFLARATQPFNIVITGNPEPAPKVVRDGPEGAGQENEENKPPDQPGR